MRDLGVGLVLTAVVTGVMYLVWGSEALVPGLTFGLLAAVINAVAVALLKSGLKGTYAKTMAWWAMGMGLRLLGVALFTLAVVREPELFPALPTAIGYVGVLLPLLFYEMRLLR